MEGSFDIKKVKFANNLKESKENTNISKKKQLGTLTLQRASIQIADDSPPKSPVSLQRMCKCFKNNH